MEVLWENGPLSTRDIILHLPDTKAHFNTIATYVRRLEQHGMIGHEEQSPRFYIYHAAVTADPHRGRYGGRDSAGVYDLYHFLHAGKSLCLCLREEVPRKAQCAGEQGKQQEFQAH